MKKHILPVGLWLMASATAAQAGPFSRFAVGVDAGTGGVGGSVTTGLVAGRLNLNAGGGVFNDGTTFTADSARFKADATIGGEDVTLSLFPVAGYGFNVTGGLVFNQNVVKATALPQAARYTFDGTTYTAAQVGSVYGRTHFSAVAPYIGIGWGNPVGAGARWTFVVNAGALYEGRPGVRLTATGAAADPRLASDVTATQATVNHDLNFLSWYPVVSVGLAYRF